MSPDLRKRLRRMQALRDELRSMRGFFAELDPEAAERLDAVLRELHELVGYLGHRTEFWHRLMAKVRP